MTVDTNLQKAVQDYWEDPSTVSIIDKNLHRIEIETVCRYLLPSDTLADIGCGNGEASVQYAARVRHCTAYERSGAMRLKAAAVIAQSGHKNITVQPGDVLDLPGAPESFDAAVSQRLLINLADWNEQKQGIENIHRLLKPGGRYLMIENTSDAFLALNDMRGEVGLPPIPQHWHNRFFDHGELMDFLKGRFQVLRVHDFGLYYFLTRVYVQMFAAFTGCGKDAVKDPVFERSDEAARIIFEKFSDRIHIDGCRALGPIQAFILRKEAS